MGKKLRNQQLFIILLVSAVLMVLYALSAYNYLVFHIVIEVFSICIAFVVFTITVNSIQYIKSNYLIILGIGYLFIGALDLLHTLAYKGMNLFMDYEYYSNQFWIATRYFESIVLLIGMISINFKKLVKVRVLIPIYTVITIVIIYLILGSHLFPTCYIENVGQTRFKVISEYIIITILVMAYIIAYRKRAVFASDIFKYMSLSIGFTIVSELAFTFYVSNYGISNLVGHYFKVFSFYFIYKAIIVTGINKPYDLIFKELKEAQNSLIVQNENLESINQELQLTVEETETANRSKSEFLSIMSHEMRTPLNGILGFAQMLEMGHLNRDQEELVSIIKSSSKTLVELINNILDVEKFSSGKMTYEERVFDLMPFFQEKTRPFERLIKNKGITSEVFIDPNLDINVIGDETKLMQVINNLVGNAIKFTDEGAIKISITGNVTEKEVGIHMEIRDSGIGISKGKEQSVFLPFKQADNSIARSYGGSGLGLAISKEIANHYRGDIWFESKYMAGSTFFCDILLERALPKVLGGIKSIDEAGETIKKDINTHNMLLVEDDIVNQKLMKKFFENYHISVDIASNGMEAVRYCSENAYTTILMDCQMPIMDGFEATKRIREEYMFKGRIIAMTGLSLEEEKKKCIDIGMDKVLVKPIDLGELAEYLSLNEQVIDPKKIQISTVENEEIYKEARLLVGKIGFDYETCLDLIITFLKQVEIGLIKAEKYLQEGRLDAAARTFHQLKGAAGAIKNNKLKLEFEKAERMIKSNDLKDVMGIIVSIKENRLIQDSYEIKGEEYR